jgi:hypothetical protein
MKFYQGQSRLRQPLFPDLHCHSKIKAVTRRQEGNTETSIQRRLYNPGKSVSADWT